MSNLSGSAQGIYQGFYVQRGNIPERPIGELKNGLGSDRLSSSRFLANSQKLLSHVVAYAIVVLFREACRTAAAGLPSEAEVPESVLAHPRTERPNSAEFTMKQSIAGGIMRRLHEKRPPTWGMARKARRCAPLPSPPASPS